MKLCDEQQFNSYHGYLETLREVANELPDKIPGIFNHNGNSIRQCDIPSLTRLAIFKVQKRSHSKKVM